MQERKINSEELDSQVNGEFNTVEKDVSNIKSNDFLTPEDLLVNNKKENQINEFKAPLLPPNVPNFPDLHGADNVMPNVSQRKNIAENVKPESIALGKETLIDDAIKRDIDSVRQKNMHVKMDPKDILKAIISKGEYTESFELYGAKWTMRALDQNDSLMALDEVKDNLESYVGKISANMFAHVVFSLEAINDVPIYQWFPEIKLEDFHGNKQEYILACKIALKQYLGAMPPNVIDSLYDKYLEVDRKRNEALEELKNS